VLGGLVAGGEPDALVAGDVGERLVEVLRPEGLADDERVQAMGRSSSFRQDLDRS
jgi:hypothetical protein